MESPWGRFCWGWRPEGQEHAEQEKTDVPAKSGREKIQASSSLVLSGPSPDWTMLTRIGEGHLLNSIHQFKCWHLSETPLQTHAKWCSIRSLGFCSPVKLACKINYHLLISHILSEVTLKHPAVTIQETEMFPKPIRLPALNLQSWLVGCRLCTRRGWFTQEYLEMTL